MKHFADLVASDFPNIDPARFTEWKQATIAAKRNAWVVSFVIALPGILLAINTYNYLVTIGVFAAIGIAGHLAWSKARSLQKELGITREAIKKALASK